jgi:3'(2'), 5'-bisphosphate nucleotidase
VTATDEEIAAAVSAVRRASTVCASVQGHLAIGDTLTKGDDSPVTVADFAAQAVVCAELTEALGDVFVVGEEVASDLTDDARTSLRNGVVDIVSRSFERPVSVDQVLDWISIGSAEATTDRYWTLDPIDGTKGFLRGEQYAVALALIEHGEVVAGVLGCPNLPNADGSAGAIFVAAEGGAEVYTTGTTEPIPIRVANPMAIADARLCESVESGHSDQDQSVQIAGLLGISAEPYRIDSQGKYGAVARGDASIYLRLPTRADYVEKIWDHAAGMYVVEQAGGTVTDIDGKPLDFSIGARLANNRGVVATSGAFHGEVIDAVDRVLG